MNGVCEKCGNLDQEEEYCQVEGCPYKGFAEQEEEAELMDPVPDVPAAKKKK